MKSKYAFQVTQKMNNPHNIPAKKVNTFSKYRITEKEDCWI
jgi:hypothetical protein